MSDLSVVILTCGRKEELTETLRNLEKQSLGNKEIILVDNNSSDGTYEYVSQNFPNVIIERLDENNASAGRNVGIKKASGDIVVTIDDDIYFKSLYSLENIVKLFENVNAGVICFKIYDYKGTGLAYNNWYHPKPIGTSSDKEFLTDYISEGAVAFRKSVFLDSGYYPDDFFLGHEGYDLALRIIDNGYDILYSPKIEVIHKHSPKLRQKCRNSYYDTRNVIWLLIRNYPWIHLFYLLPSKLLVSLIFSISRGCFLWCLKGLFDGFAGIPYHMKGRTPVKQTTLKKIKEIRRECPRGFSKLKEFCAKHKLRREVGKNLS